ncbi:MAG: hypothetical protein SGBAC_003414 [Bacillariaceae sp.]
MAASIRYRGVTPKSAWSMLCDEQEQQSSSSTRLPLHLVDHPSFPLHLGVNAIAGPAGSGKTQLCLSLYLSKIFVNWVRNQDDLLHMLRYGLPKLLKEHPSISLVVLDGIATLFRGKDDNCTSYWVDRSAKFFQIASQSQKLSFGHQVPFLFTNEATSKLLTNNSGLLASTSRLEPALGLSWAQCINSSFFVQRRYQSSTRVLKCIKSPHMASNRSAEFAIESRGIVRIQ